MNAAQRRRKRRTVKAILRKIKGLRLDDGTIAAAKLARALKQVQDMGYVITVTKQEDGSVVVE